MALLSAYFGADQYSICLGSLGESLYCQYIAVPVAEIAMPLY